MLSSHSQEEREREKEREGSFLYSAECTNKYLRDYEINFPYPTTKSTAIKKFLLLT